MCKMFLKLSYLLTGLCRYGILWNTIGKMKNVNGNHELGSMTMTLKLCMQDPSQMDLTFIERLKCVEANL